MSNAIVVHISSDPSHLGADATSDDVDALVISLQERLRCSPYVEGRDVVVAPRRDLDDAWAIVEDHSLPGVRQLVERTYRDMDL